MLSKVRLHQSQLTVLSVD